MPLLLLPPLPPGLPWQLFHVAGGHERLLRLRHAPHGEGMGHHPGGYYEAALPSGGAELIRNFRRKYLATG